MASFEIPEEIIGVPLFVPDLNNYFSVEAAGMPNGDSCLIVHGDVSQDYKAFQKPQVTSPALFTDGSVLNWAMTAWLKMGALTNDVTATMLKTMLSIQTIDADHQHLANAYGAPAGGSTNSKTLWAMTHYGTTGVYWRRLAQNGFSAGSPACGTTALATSLWKMVTINVIGNVQADMYIDDSATAVSSGSGGNFYGGQAANASRMFCIGAYSDHAAASGRPGEWRIGKLAFHDHPLNLTERSLLYHAMVD